ncbi:MAG: hypothetical protein WCR16_01420 [Bacilli bacterium]
MERRTDSAVILLRNASFGKLFFFLLDPLENGRHGLTRGMTFG